MKILTKDAIKLAFQQAIISGKLEKGCKAAIFYAKELLLDRLQLLRSTFPDNCLHAIAIKTCAEPQVLQTVVQAGFGLEAASFEEVLLAIKAGISPHNLVFDSPVKTREEITACHEQFPGMLVNANCLEELARYPANFSGRLGLRINPLVKPDAPGIFDVASQQSKFGVAINEEDKILQACIQHPQIEGLHLHIGSGIKDFTANIEAIQRILQLAKKIQQHRKEKNLPPNLKFIDIGGGINFNSIEGDFGIQTFVNQLKNTPLFENYQVITEYGKFIHRANSFAISRVEYVIEKEDIHTAYIHLGADLFVRKVYSDLKINYPWFIIPAIPHQNQTLRRYNIAGPLCFAGDFLYYNVKLPQLKEGDWFVMQEMGANTWSMWSRHCNRKLPPFVVY